MRQEVKMAVDKKVMRLYAVTDRSWLDGETLYEQVEKAIKGGATFVQLREKGLDARNFLMEARQIKELCKKHNVPFVVNDSVDIALAIDADGVHVGQGDMEAGDVRQLLGEDKIIGVTAKTVEQAVRAQERGADYLGVGAVFPSPTKPEAIGISHEQLKEICEAVNIPVVAIGGITSDNVMQLKGSGVDGVAVVSAVFGQQDIMAAAQKLREQVEDMVQ
jgi:thiamine-phosphate pyrophosphorylase